MFKILRAQPSRTVLALMAVSTFVPLSAHAQANAGAVFSPVAPWTVGATELASMRGLQGVKLPCVVSSEFDNGYIIRFSGGGNNMLAMAIDFRQQVFQKGRKYPAAVSIGNAYMKQISGSAIAPGALVFSLRDVDGFYAALKGGQMMELDVQGNVFKFSLQDIGQSFAQLEQCYSGVKTPQVEPVLRAANAQNNANAVPPAVLVPAVDVEPLPQSFQDILKADTGVQPSAITPMPMRVSNADGVAPATPVARNNAAQQRVSVAPSSQWQARAGEDVRVVLERWAAAAGYDLQWQANDGGRVAQDISLNGDFEQAVSQLLAENDAASGIQGRFENASSVAQNPAPSGKWSGNAGANIQTVLEDWAKREGVYVVWNDYMSIPLKNSISQSGTFEQAVESLLDQYSSDQRRPVARLNSDPATGQRTLLMNLDKSS